MTFQGDLYAALSQDAGVVAAVGDRFFPNDTPEGVTTPFIVYYEFATPREQGFGGIVVSKPRIQYSIYADTYADCFATATALRTALGKLAYPVVFEDERGNQDNTTGLHRRDIDVRIPHAGV